MTRLHIIFGRPPERGGGSALAAKDLLEWQTAQGYETVCLSTGWFDGKEPQLRPAIAGWTSNYAYEMWNVGAHPASGLAEVSTSRESWRLLESVLARHPRIDVVHISNLLTLPPSVVGFLKAAGKRVVIEIHDYLPVCSTLYLFRSDTRVACRDFEEGRGCQACVGDAPSHASLIAMERARAALKSGPAYSAARWLWRRSAAIRPTSGVLASTFVERRRQFKDALAAADAVIAISTRQRQSLIEHGLADVEMTILPLRVQDLPDQIVERRFSLPLKCVFIGSLSRQKGATTVVRAFQKIDPELAVVDLFGWADGSLDRELHTLAGGHDGIHFHGRYGRGELPSIAKAAHIGLVLPEWEEAFGLTGIELLSYGVPLVTTGLGGTADYAINGENALVVPPADPLALRQALIRLAKDEDLWRHLARNSRPPDYTFENRCSDIEELYVRARAAGGPG